MSPVEFRDELRDRHELEFLDVPSKFDGYNAHFSVSQALGFKVGGFISLRHDEGRDDLAYFSSAGFMPSNARDEPLIHLCRDSEGVHASITLIDKTLTSKQRSILIAVMS